MAEGNQNKKQRLDEEPSTSTEQDTTGQYYGVNCLQYRLDRTNVHDDKKFRFGTHFSEFTEVIDASWSEMIAFKSKVPKKIKRYIKRNGEALNFKLFRNKKWDCTTIIRFPEREFIGRIRNPSDATRNRMEQVLAKEENKVKEEFYNNTILELLEPVKSEAGEWRYYYIQHPAEPVAQHDQSTKLQQYQFKSGGIPELFIALLFRWIVSAMRYLDPNTTAHGSLPGEKQYILRWRSPETPDSMAVIIEKWIETDTNALPAGHYLKHFLNKVATADMLSDQIVNLASTMCVGKNYDDQAIAVGVAVSNLATALYELARKEKVEDMIKARNERKKTDSSKKGKKDKKKSDQKVKKELNEEDEDIEPYEPEGVNKKHGIFSVGLGSGNVNTVDCIFADYIVAECKLNQTGPNREEIVDPIVPLDFIKDRHGDVYSAALNLKHDDGSPIPRPTAGFRPDWVTKFKGGPTVMIGECKATDDKLLPSGYSTAIFAAAAQLQYGDKALLCHTSSTRMRLFELTMREEQLGKSEDGDETGEKSEKDADKKLADRHKISVSEFHTEEYELQPRFDHTHAVMDDTKSNECPPEFEMVDRSKKFAFRDDADIAIWKSLHRNIRVFLHASFQMIAAMAAAFLKRNVEDMEIDYKWLDRAGFVTRCEYRMTAGPRLRKIRIPNMFKYGKESYLAWKEFFKKYQNPNHINRFQVRLMDLLNRINNLQLVNENDAMTREIIAGLDAINISLETNYGIDYTIPLELINTTLPPCLEFHHEGEPDEGFDFELGSLCSLTPSDEEMFDKKEEEFQKKKEEESKKSREEPEGGDDINVEN